MATEEIIALILSKNPEISRENLIGRLEEERRKTGGFISDETLLRMIAAEFGIKLQIEAPLPTLSIANLVPGLSDITVIGRVVAIFPPKEFNARNSGKVASLLITDESGMLRVVLWKDKTSLVESGKLQVGQIIRVSHGYTKEDRSGKVELHIADKGEIQINPQDIEAKNYPDISKFTIKIAQITHAYRNKKVNLKGEIKELHSPSTFRRKDSSTGKVMRLVLSDDSGEIPVIVWNEKVDELEKTAKKDTRLQLINAKVKKAADGSLEIHVEEGTYVEIPKAAEKILKIADLKEGLICAAVEGEVATKPLFRDVKTSKGESVKLAIFELKDDSGGIWVSAWRTHADTIKNLKVGDKIRIENAYVRKGFGDQLELSTRNTARIRLLRHGSAEDEIRTRDL